VDLAEALAPEVASVSESAQVLALEAAPASVLGGALALAREVAQALARAWVPEAVQVSALEVAPVPAQVPEVARARAHPSRSIRRNLQAVRSIR